ncbi:DUF58 domain-containing protein [Candidatus Bipolaricaulota bacterium]|nr:DUF58 domain-containing protein [Candidatus Bipolaricaulota bacterium]
MGIGLAILILGMLLTNGAFLALAVPPILFSCFSAIQSMQLRLPVLNIERTVNRHRMIEGEEVKVTVDVSSTFGTTGRYFISVIDTLPGGAQLVDGENQFLGPFVQGQSAQFSYRVVLPRGKHVFKEFVVTGWSRWGLASRMESVAHESIVIAHPKTDPVGAITIRPRRTRAFAGPVKANQGGQGLDFFGCRSYVPGDDIRRVNWRAYARQDTLIVNEYELERLADVNVIVDARLQAHCRLGAETTFDHSLRAAGSLASHFLRVGNIVGLLVYGDLVHWVFPGVGKRQERKILDALATSYAADKEVFEDLRKVPTRLFPAQSQLVFISPLTDEDDVEVIALLIDQGYSILLVCPHATTWEAEQIGPTPSAQLATRMANLRRSLFLDSLVRTGTRIVNWDVSEPLALAIERDLGVSFFRRHV